MAQPTFAQMKAATDRRRAFATTTRADTLDTMHDLIDRSYALDKENPYWADLDTDHDYEFEDVPDLETPDLITREGPSPNEIRADDEDDEVEDDEVGDDFDDEDDEDFEDDDDEEEPDSTDLSVINLPNISDVSFPSLIGATAPATPTKRKKRKPVKYKGVTLSRRPMAFEAKVLSLSEIPPRLDTATAVLETPDTPLFFTLSDVARFGAEQVLLELVRQGAPERILATPPDCTRAVLTLTKHIEADRATDLDAAFRDAEVRVSRRRVSPARVRELARELSDRWAPGIIKRHAKRAVNLAFALGRATVIEYYRRPKGFDLKSKTEMLEDGDLWVDAVVQSAVMDTNTCEECEDVDGEVMDLGEARQEELHPPYVKCLGGDRCRCMQIALLSDGSEIDVDEVPEDAYDEED